MADDFVSRKCCHCGTVAEYPLPADFKLAVPKYLDGKPFEDGNFSLKRTVMRCPKCGYVSFDVSRNILRDSNIVSSNEYESIIKSDLFPKYIANYIAIGYIYERQNEYYHASHAYLCAAWGCRDEKREKEADILLEKAAKLILKHIGSNEFKSHPDLNMLQCAVDILRQIREFENTKKLAAYALSKKLPEDMEKIFLLEQSLCDNYISAPHAYKPENETKIASFADLFNRFAEAKTGDDKTKLQAFADAFEFVNSVKYKEVAKGVSLVYNPFFNQGLDFVRAVNLVRDVLSDEKETSKTAEKQVVPENKPAERPAPIKVLTKAEDLADKPQSAPAREEALNEEAAPEILPEKEEVTELQTETPVILTQTALENERKETEPEITEELSEEEAVAEEAKPVVLPTREEIRPVKVLTTVEDLKEPEPEEERIEEELETSDDVAKEELAEEAIECEASPEEGLPEAEEEPEQAVEEDISNAEEISATPIDHGEESAEETFENGFYQTPDEIAEEAAEESLPEMNVSPEEPETESEISEEIENEDLSEEETIIDEPSDETAAPEEFSEEEQIPDDESEIEFDEKAEIDTTISTTLEEEHVEEELEASDEVAKEELAEEEIDREEEPEESESVDEPEETEDVDEESETLETQDELVEDESEEFAPEEVVSEALEEEPEQTVEDEDPETESTEIDGLTENVTEETSEESPSITEEASEAPETESVIDAMDEEVHTEPDSKANASSEEKQPDLEEENMAGTEDDAFASTYEEQCETITTLASIDGSISVSEVQSLFEYGFVKAKGILERMATDGLLERMDDPETFKYVR